MSGSSQQRQRRADDVALLTQNVTAGNVRALAQVMTLIENREPIGSAVLTQLAASHPATTVIGITGYPGAGKSTLITQLVTAYRQQGKKVGVIAVDATSPLTGGALLGDRIRMQEHAGDPCVFIRSVASRGQHGGIAAGAANLVTVLAAAGYEVVLVETVGVGQEDLGIVNVAQTIVAVVAPGLGDEVQAMKAGLFEVAHVVVVNKGDHEGAETTVHDLTDWVRQVIRTVAVKGEGIPELVAAIADHQRERDLHHKNTRAPRKKK